jgi:hypothetical protein
MTLDEMTAHKMTGCKMLQNILVKKTVIRKYLLEVSSKSR